MSKAQATLIENVLLILLGSLMLTFIGVTMYGFYQEHLKREIENSLRQIAIDTASNILRLYEAGRKSRSYVEENSSRMLLELELSLPERVSGRSYEMLLVSPNPIWSTFSTIMVGGKEVVSVPTTPGAKIIVKTTQKPYITVEYDLPNIDVSLQGITDGTDAVLRYYRYNFNGIERDKIVLGKNQEILVDVVSVG